MESCVRSIQLGLEGDFEIFGSTLPARMAWVLEAHIGEGLGSVFAGTSLPEPAAAAGDAVVAPGPTVVYVAVVLEDESWDAS